MEAIQRYIDAWLEPDAGRRAALIADGFARDGRIWFGDQVIAGREALAAAIDAFHADPQRPAARVIGPVDAGGTTFRFRVELAWPDGRRRELIDLGELDDDHQIARLYTFPATDGDAAFEAGSPTARAAERYVELFSAPDPAERRARIEACFTPAARWVARRSCLTGWDEIAAMVEAALADPRGLIAERASAIQVAGATFRFATLARFADGSPPFIGEDAGELDGDGRIAALYVFAGRV